VNGVKKNNRQISLAGTFGAKKSFSNFDPVQKILEYDIKKSLHVQDL
jgi:hypothetical protein